MVEYISFLSHSIMEYSYAAQKAHSENDLQRYHYLWGHVKGLQMAHDTALELERMTAMQAKENEATKAVGSVSIRYL